MASFYPLKLSLANKTTGVPITSYTQLNLRWSEDSYATAIHSQIGTGDGGIYTFGSVGTPVAAGDYKLYDNTTELTAFGVIRVGEPGAVLTSGDQLTIAGNKTFTGIVTLTDAILGDTLITGDMTIATGKSLTVDKTPVTANEVLRLKDLDGVALLSGGNEIADTQLFTGEVGFDQTPVCATADGTQGASYLVNQGYIQDIVDNIEVTPFQESSNNRRLMVDGIQDTNKVYTTWAEAQNNARSYATSNWRITIEIKGAGESSNEITVTDGSIPGNNPFNSFVNVKGDNQGIKLQVSDIAYSIAALGNTIIENVSIERDDSTAGTPTFENFIFKDCYFNFDTASLGFINCQFKGVNYVKNVGSISFDGNCIGGHVATNGAITARMFGADGLTITDF